MTYRGPDRRENVADTEFRAHVYTEIDSIKERQAAMDEKLDELLAILRASRIGAAMLKWVAGLGLAMVTAYAAWRGVR
jgi:hypothetical protein